MTSPKKDSFSAPSPHNGCAVLIIPPEKHPITEDQIDKDALFVLNRLHEAGFSGYLVGGGVRDLYLGKKPKDFDISTNARPGQLRKLFANSNTIGRRFRLVQVFFKGGKTIEVSTLRSLSEHDLDGPETVLAPNNTFGTLSEDAKRRDLTINALFYEIQKHTIIDYVNGTEDLENAVIRVVGEPEKRFRRDPVRMMRAIRHSARNNFTIDSDTWEGIIDNVDKLKLCPPSRLRDEALKDLYSGASAEWFDLAVRSGIFQTLFSVYKELLAPGTPAYEETTSQLINIFKTIDRINTICVDNGVHRQKDFFLLALILIPWAEANYQILSTRRKGAELFNLSKKIRNVLDAGIGIELNLRRSLRQESVSLLINLSQLLYNKQKNGWPKWLKKKSYFKKALLFYNFYQEALAGEEMDTTSIALSTKQEAAQERPLPRKSKSRKRCRPAFAPNTKGGVFGFKR